MQIRKGKNRWREGEGEREREREGDGERDRKKEGERERARTREGERKKVKKASEKEKHLTETSMGIRQLQASSGHKRCTGCAGTIQGISRGVQNKCEWFRIKGEHHLVVGLILPTHAPACPYRGTSIRKRPPPNDPPRTLGVGLR